MRRREDNIKRDARMRGGWKWPEPAHVCCVASAGELVGLAVRTEPGLSFLFQPQCVYKSPSGKHLALLRDM
jgi:hypothetical protein